jgi:hypothetical protein
MNPASSGESMGARAVPTLSCARWYLVTCSSHHRRGQYVNLHYF